MKTTDKSKDRINNNRQINKDRIKQLQKKRRSIKNENKTKDTKCREWGDTKYNKKIIEGKWSYKIWGPIHFDSGPTWQIAVEGG